MRRLSRKAKLFGSLVLVCTYISCDSCEKRQKYKLRYEETFIL